MNLHGIAGPYIAAVNPPLLGTVSISTGYTTNPDATRTPTYRIITQIPVPLQVQAMSGPDLAQTSGLNLQGTVRAVYFNGQLEGLDRPAGKGGDMLRFNGQNWLVVAVLEAWDAAGWCKVAVVLQG